VYFVVISDGVFQGKWTASEIRNCVQSRRLLVISTLSRSLTSATLYQDCYTHMVSSTVVELLYILYITVTIWGIPSVGIGIVGMVYVLGLF
jgi:hypothetical protein